MKSGWFVCPLDCPVSHGFPPLVIFLCVLHGVGSFDCHGWSRVSWLHHPGLGGAGVPLSNESGPFHFSPPMSCAHRIPEVSRTHPIPYHWRILLYLLSRVLLVHLFPPGRGCVSSDRHHFLFLSSCVCCCSSDSEGRSIFSTCAHPPGSSVLWLPSLSSRTFLLRAPTGNSFVLTQPRYKPNHSYHMNFQQVLEFTNHVGFNLDWVQCVFACPLHSEQWVCSWYCVSVLSCQHCNLGVDIGNAVSQKIGFVLPLCHSSIVHGNRLWRIP